MNINLPYLLSKFIDDSRGIKCRAWFIINCIKYIRDNQIDIYAYYEGMNNEKRIKEVKCRGESGS